MPLQGGAESIPHSAMYGYSEGLVYPPFDAISKVRSLIR